MEKKLTTAQLKVGDVLIRENDHIGRPDDRRTIEAINTTARRTFRINGRFYTYTGAELSAENYRIVERDGVRIGSFFVKYW